MANSLSITNGVNGSVNGLTINQNSSVNLTPTGSFLFAESVFVQTGSFQQLYSGSAVGVSIISLANSSTTASVGFAVSASGVVNNFGTIGPAGVNANNGSNISWNQSFGSLYAIAYNTASYVNAILVAQ